MCKCEIDIENISKDLDAYSNKILNKERFDSSLGNEIIQERLEIDDSNSNDNSVRNSNNFSVDNEYKCLETVHIFCLVIFPKPSITHQDSEKIMKTKIME